MDEKKKVRSKRLKYMFLNPKGDIEYTNDPVDGTFEDKKKELMEENPILDDENVVRITPTPEIDNPELETKQVSTQDQIKDKVGSKHFMKWATIFLTILAIILFYIWVKRITAVQDNPADKENIAQIENGNGEQNVGDKVEDFIKNKTNTAEESIDSNVSNYWEKPNSSKEKSAGSKNTRNIEVSKDLKQHNLIVEGWLELRDTVILINQGTKTVFDIKGAQTNSMQKLQSIRSSNPELDSLFKRRIERLDDAYWDIIEGGVNVEMSDVVNDALAEENVDLNASLSMIQKELNSLGRSYSIQDSKIILN